MLYILYIGPPSRGSTEGRDGACVLPARPHALTRSHPTLSGRQVRYSEFTEREQRLRGESGGGLLRDKGDNDPYWAAYGELVAEYRTLLFLGKSEWEVEMTPQELYAEVAALYEVCYKRGAAAAAAAASHQSRSTGTTDGTHRQPGGLGCINFPWRIAKRQLKEMKEKAKRLEELPGHLSFPR